MASEICGHMRSPFFFLFFLTSFNMGKGEGLQAQLLLCNSKLKLQIQQSCGYLKNLSRKVLISFPLIQEMLYPRFCFILGFHENNGIHSWSPLFEYMSSIHFVKINKISFWKTPWVRTHTSRSFSSGGSTYKSFRWPSPAPSHTQFFPFTHIFIKKHRVRVDAPLQ